MLLICVVVGVLACVCLTYLVVVDDASFVDIVIIVWGYLGYGLFLVCLNIGLFVNSWVSKIIYFVWLLLLVILYWLSCGFYWNCICLGWVCLFFLIAQGVRVLLFWFTLGWVGLLFVVWLCLCLISSVVGLLCGWVARFRVVCYWRIWLMDWLPVFYGWLDFWLVVC